MFTEIKGEIESLIRKQLLNLNKQLEKEPTRAFKNKSIIIDVKSSVHQLNNSLEDKGRISELENIFKEIV